MSRAAPIHPRPARSRRRALLSWSSGKDSAWALHVLRGDPTLEVVGLLTTLNASNMRVSMHGVRRALVERQAAAVGLEPWFVELPAPCSNDEYERVMAAAIARARARDIAAIAFGDLFLEDIRAYRERALAGSGVEPLFPLWGRPTAALAREMIAGGARAVITCVDPRQCPAALLGHDFDLALLDALPVAADPCAERGEFHTFACDGPAFARPVTFERGPRVVRDGFHFLDLQPVDHVRGP